jgi:hypothetical protein
MRYRWAPNVVIVDYETMREKFRFDQNGWFETKDQKLIDWIRKHKNFLKPEEEPKNVYVCKACGFETDNRGKYLAHCRTHGKGE